MNNSNNVKYVERVRLVLPYPCSNNVYYRMGRHGIYLSKQGKKFKDTVQRWYSKILIPDDANYAIDFTLLPKMTKLGVQYKRTLDIDNWFKGILDSLQGLIYHDDKQVREFTRARFGDPVSGGGCNLIIYKMI